MPPTSVVFMLPARLVDALESVALSSGKTLSDVVEEAMSSERSPWLVPQGSRLKCVCSRRHCICAQNRDRLTESSLNASPRSGTLCALCVCTIREGSGIGAPLGANDALVTICAGCSDGVPQARLGPERGYSIPDVFSCVMSVDDPRAHTSKVLGTGRLRPPIPHVKPRTLGWILVRVDMRVNGRQMSRSETYETVRREPWFPSSRCLGIDRFHLLFEHPDPKVAAMQRARTDNPTKTIEKYRT